MSEAARFLHALGNALENRRQAPVGATGSLAEAQLVRRLDDLLAADPSPRFRFAAGEGQYGRVPIHALDGWPWAGWLALRGIEWLEFRAPAGNAAIARLLEAASAEQPVFDPLPGLRFGAGESPRRGRGPVAEEFMLMRELLDQARNGVAPEPVEIDAVVASLAVTLIAQGETVLPLLSVVRPGDYQAAHAINTALMALALAEALGLSADDRTTAAGAALLHDVGMVVLPELAPGGEYSPGLQARIQDHPVEGARLLLQRPDRFEAAALAAYEHHLRAGGQGYPRLNYPREAHYLSRLVAVCDAFDGIQAPRPERPGRAPLAALAELEGPGCAGLDPELVTAFAKMVRELAGSGRLILTSRVF
jgi:hypothetical protein